MKTSFGSLERIKLKNGKEAELLKFQSSGRPHKHAIGEEFTVLSGEGVLLCEDKETAIVKGGTYVIPPNVTHFMKPARENEELVLVVTYCS